MLSPFFIAAVAVDGAAVIVAAAAVAVVVVVAAFAAVMFDRILWNAAHIAIDTVTIQYVFVLQFVAHLKPPQVKTSRDMLTNQ